jgi:hypothetical protein
MKMQRALEKRCQVHTFHNLAQSGERVLASLKPGNDNSWLQEDDSGRKTTSRDKTSPSLKLWRTARRRDRTLFDILQGSSNERPFTCFSQNQERYILEVFPITKEKISPSIQQRLRDFQLFRLSLFLICI